jgi:hypothetical protein
MPVNREDVERIVAAVPSFRTTWERFIKESESEESPLWYVGMSELAHYVVDNYAQGTTTEFAALFATIEVLLHNHDPELEGLIAVGLFEDIQNIASHRDFGYAIFRPWLEERSLVVWDEIDAGMQKVAVWEQGQKPRWWQFWRRRETLDPEKALSQVESADLRKIIESNFRRRQ